jgi:hypothetical protein
MIPWPWLLAVFGLTGVGSFFVWKSPMERRAWVKRHIIDDEPGCDEGHAATRTLPKQRIPDPVLERERAEWERLAAKPDLTELR